MLHTSSSSDPVVRWGVWDWAASLQLPPAHWPGKTPRAMLGRTERTWQHCPLVDKEDGVSADGDTAVVCSNLLCMISWWLWSQSAWEIFDHFLAFRSCHVMFCFVWKNCSLSTDICTGCAGLLHHLSPHLQKNSEMTLLLSLLCLRWITWPPHCSESFVKGSLFYAKFKNKTRVRWQWIWLTEML